MTANGYSSLGGCKHFFSVLHQLWLSWQFSLKGNVDWQCVGWRSAHKKGQDSSAVLSWCCEDCPSKGRSLGMFSWSTLLARVLLDEVARIYLILSHVPSNILGCTRFKFPEKFIFDMRYKVRHRSGTASITWQWWSNGSTVCFRRDFVKVEKKSYQKAEQLMVLVWVLFESFVLKQDV